MPAPVLTFDSESTWTGADGSQTMSITPGTGESVLAVYANDGGLSAAPSPTLAGNAPDLIEFGISPFVNHTVTIAIWHEPGTSALTYDTGVGFNEAGAQLFTVTDVDGTTPADGDTNAGLDNLTDTGVFNISSATGDTPISAIISESDPTPDQTSARAALSINTGAVFLECSYGTGAATVDMGFSSISGQGAIAGFNINQAAGGGSANPWYYNLQQQIAGGAT